MITGPFLLFINNIGNKPTRLKRNFENILIFICNKFTNKYVSVEYNKFKFFSPYIYTVCQKNLCTEEKNVKCDLHSSIPTIKSLHTFFYFFTHSITVLVYDHKALIVF